MNEELAETLETHEQAESLSELLRLGKDEMNFAEFPLTSLSDKVSTGDISLKFEDRIYDDRKKKLVVRKRVIEGSKEYGLPTATDDLVILALIQLTKLKNGFTSREVDFTRHELINLLGWPNKGQSYSRIALSLHRIAAVTYHFENSWWDHRRKVWTTKIFGIIDTVELNDSRESDGQCPLFPSRISWNQVIFDSFQAGYLRSLDFQLCMSFRHPTSLRIYRFMGKRFYLRPDWTFDLREFAHVHLGMSRKYEGGTQLARKLKPAIDELEAVGFLEALPEKERFSKKGRDWSIRLVQKEASPVLPLLEGNAEQAEAVPLEGELIRRGVTPASAAELFRQHPAERIAAKLEVFDWLMAKADKKVAKNPAGYLVKSIADDYAAPKGFRPQAARERHEAEQRQKAQAEAERRRKAQAEKAHGRAQAEAVAAYRQTLSPEALARLEAEALAQADALARENYENPALAKMRPALLRSIVEEHILRSGLHLKPESA